jgi:RNA polymerase sigma factor (sigma-70 family)
VSAEERETEAILRVLDANPDRAAEKYLALFQRLRSFFYSRARGGAVGPEDLAQETLRRGFSRILAGVEIYVDPANYFLKIASNVAIEYWRSRARSREDSLELEDLPDTRNVDFEDADVRICLEQCLRLLPDDDREALLRYQSEDHQALAAALGLPEGTLRVKVHRARNKLTELVRKASRNVQES